MFKKQIDLMYVIITGNVSYYYQYRQMSFTFLIGFHHTFSFIEVTGKYGGERLLIDFVVTFT